MIKNTGSRSHSRLPLLLVALAVLVVLRVAVEALYSIGTGPIGLAFLTLCAVPVVLLASVLALAAAIASCFDRREETRAWLEEQRRR